jgi:hypothetical protein
LDQQVAIDNLYEKLANFIRDGILAKKTLPADAYGITDYVLAGGNKPVLVDIEPVGNYEREPGKSPIEQAGKECFIVSQFLDAVGEVYGADQGAMQVWRTRGQGLVRLAFKTNDIEAVETSISRIVDLSLSLVESVHTGWRVDEVASIVYANTYLGHE